MTAVEDFDPIPLRPKCWDDVVAITEGRGDVPISVIERGRVDWKYEFSASDMRPCGRAGCHQDHANGWLVALPGGGFINIGKDCAAKYAHAEMWEARVALFNERIAADARTKAVLEARDEAQRKLYAIDNMPELDAAIALHDSFIREAKGPLLREIEERAERGKSSVERERRLSPEEIELRKAMLMGSAAADGPAPHVASVERVHVADIAGLQCFRPGHGPRERRDRLLRLIDTLLKWSPAAGDIESARALQRATRELAPDSNALNSSLIATQQFFSNRNLQALMELDVTRRQAIVSIERDATGIRIRRRPHWGKAA